MDRKAVFFAAILLLFALSGRAGLQPVWLIGVDEDPLSSGYAPTDEFSQENFVNDNPPGQVARLPGDPQYNAGNNPDRDDDFYLAGTYPAGFNNLSSVLAVPNDEPFTAFERALTSGDRTNRIHFFLNGEQAGPESRLRLSIELVYGGSWISPPGVNGEGFGEHDIEIRFKGSGAKTLLLQRRVDRDKLLVLDFPASSVQAQAGPNSIEIVRPGPAVSGTTFWVQFDFLSLEADTNGLADADGDGLPRWWEVDHHLSDANSADAAGDGDGDGLTALQEYNGGTNPTDPNNADTDRDGLNDSAEITFGTNPLLADTDGDSISDGEEVNGAPPSSPLFADGDSDGAPDSLERRVGTDPLNPISKPTTFAGAIGIHFVSQADLDGTLAANETAGVVPQTFWNETVPLRTWNRTNGSTADFVSPASGQLVRSDGTVLSSLTVNWTADQNHSSRNKSSSDAKLMNGFIRASTAMPAVLAISNIPFANYDLLVHVGGSYDTQRGQVRLGNDPATDRFFRSGTTAPQQEFVELRPGLTNFQRGNFIRYTNLSSPTATITVSNLNGWAVGIHAVQIIDRNLDNDGSGIPDWWEMRHALEPGSVALAATDTDGDGLSNSQEFSRGSNPRLADTDGDGLTDNQESAANSLFADSDGDGVSDYDELNQPIPSNPDLADTDGDGVNDRDEIRFGTDPVFNPTNSPSFVGWVPFHRNSPARWEWNLENVQLVWDHGAGALSPNIWNEDQLVSFAVRNAASGDWRTFGLELRYFHGSVSYLFHSEYTGGFSYSGQPTSTIWQAEYGASVPDLKSALGFSGYGPADISDRLQFRLFAQRGTGNSWAVTFEIRNQTSNTVVVTRSFNNCAAAANVDNGTATWTDYSGNPGVPDIAVHQGVRMLITPTPLETLSAFADAKDSDNDGMPDVWEDNQSFNKNVSSDATGDADLDGVLNRDEFVAGTNPHLADTDGDGIRDDVELANASNPDDATSKPALAGQTWPTGEDLDGNGLSDAWESRYRAFNLSANGDEDGDGATNGKEARWGTNPFDADSIISLGLAKETNDVVLSWVNQPLKQQELFSSPALTNWQPVADVPWLSGDTLTLRLTNRFLIIPGEFYLLNTHDRDSDGDGLSDWAESVIGSDPMVPDSAHSAAPVINGTGTVIGSVSGDYAAFVDQMNGGPGGGTGLVTRAQAARLLQQATFGVTLDEIERVRRLGIEGWIDDQITNQPATLHRPYMESVYDDFNGPRTDLTYSFNEMDDFINGNNATTPFARAAIDGPDQLRQRVAFALSQILVISRRDANLENKPLAVTDYYDVFVRNAFGNYSDVLREVTFHPVMGLYLSHVGNQKARPEINQYPDENFAREVQQLFTIGLWELNLDGTRKLDGFGQPIPTYGNQGITEFARVFTGLWFGGQQWGEGGWLDAQASVPMRMWAGKHDYGEKHLLKGFVIPERAPTAENGVRDIDDALRNLMDHPNIAPFLSRQLIQFLVTSNPSTNYVARVAATFVDDGSGHRGNLGAVVKAILLDEEARDARWFNGAEEFGRLKEPVHRAMAIARAGQVGRFEDLLWWSWGEFNSAAFQEPTFSPSVFNFYRPTYQPPGLLTENGLVGPAFQITDSYSSISFPNKLWEITQDGLRLYSTYRFPPDYSELTVLATDTAKLMDQVNLLFCGGTMTAETRGNILDAINQIPAYDTLLRTRLAFYLAATCPEGAVQR